MAKRLFTSESVTEGHPDKVCDAIADAVLDAIYEKDPNARVACEVACTTGLVLVMGEITTNCFVDIQKIARRTINEIGYTSPNYGFDGNTCAVIVAIDEQSPDIALGVDKSSEAKQGHMADLNTGAGDQGMMFGYACEETPELMPMAIMLSHKIAKKLAQVRKDGTFDYLRPDGKTQVTVQYDGDTPVRIDTVVLSAQHDPGVSQEKIHTDMIEGVIKTVLPPELVDSETKFLINPTGMFIVGGPHGDSGLTGRKIIVDTYGGYGRHGGGAFAGKDCTKVDRSACYAARYIAKNIVAQKLARRVEVQITYAIGVANPVSICVDAFGTESIPVEQIQQRVLNAFDLRPAAIIERFKLRQQKYRQTAAYGHFGRSDLDLPWERTDLSL